MAVDGEIGDGITVDGAAGEGTIGDDTAGDAAGLKMEKIVGDTTDTDQQGTRMSRYIEYNMDVTGEATVKDEKGRAVENNFPEGEIHDSKSTYDTICIEHAR